MRYLSLFSGIEAASVAWEPLGWTPAAFAEIDPFCCAVLAHHWPDAPNLGDVTRITDDRIAALGHIDLVVGGSPCTDLSIAGKRAGLAGKQSCLFHEQVRIFHAARNLCGARWLLWENVPGIFSSNNGRDFATVAGKLVGIEIPVPPRGFGSEGAACGPVGIVEWATLDAQWFGVAQRRARYFALLDTGDWTHRPPVLLEPDRLRGDSPPRRETGQDVAPTLGARTRGGGGLGTDFDCGGLITGSLVARCGRNGAAGNSADMLICGTVSSKWAKGSSGPAGDECQNLVVHTLRVRCITPLEAERLQGFPDGHTAIPYRGKPASDSPRYRAIGNSMAVPVMRWIGDRIQGAVDYEQSLQSRPNNGEVS